VGGHARRNYKILSGKYLRDNPREMSSPWGSRRVIASCSIQTVTRSSPSGRARDRAPVHRGARSRLRLGMDHAHGPWCIVSMLQASSRLRIRGSCR